MTINWGILGCGNISHDFCLALIRTKSVRNKLAACASASSVDSAKKFAAKFNITKAYGSYEEMIADPEIRKEIRCFPLRMFVI